jgi:hypothetical protein
VKILLAIVCCHHRAWATNVIRETWVADIKGRCDYKFFYGAGTHSPIQDDEVILTGDDAYRGLACKVQNICKWTLANGYDGLWKLDDDTYCRPERILKVDVEGKDYIGRINGATDKYHMSRYARGGVGYFLSKKSMTCLASQPVPNPNIPQDYAEDSWVGRHLTEGGFECVNDGRLRCAPGSGPNRGPRPNGFQGWKIECPTMHNDIITTCEFLGSEMLEVHKEWLRTREKFDGLMGRLRVK